jgi:two-component system OmpR family sensor kinase
VARIVVEDIARSGAAARIALSLPDGPVMSGLDPDAFGILCRNLLENALRHGISGAPVTVALTPEGRFVVANDGPVVALEVLARLTGRFERAGAAGDGAGLGLAIVAAMADRIDSALALRSPRPGAASGFEAAITLPTGR